MTTGTKRHYKGRGGKSVRVSAGKKERILELLRGGKSPSEIAQSEGVPRGKVIRISRSL